MTPTPIGRRRAPTAIAVALLTACTAATTPVPAQTLDVSRPEVRAFIGNLVGKDGFERRYVESVFARIESKESILEAMRRPAEKTKPWFEYREIFLTPRRISGGVDFQREHEIRLRQVAQRTGVPAEVITAIIGVETFYGTRTGSFRAIDAIGTLAFDYPPRAEYFSKELRNLFLLARDERLDITTLQGSYAGALGPPQFMPSSYLNYAVDGSGDGRRDLLKDWDDVIASVANYFVKHGWQAGQPVFAEAQFARGATRVPGPNELVLKDTVGSLARQGVQFTTDLPATAPALLFTLDVAEGQQQHWVGFQNFYTITRYNRSVMYALAVAELSEAIRASVQAPVASVTDAGG
jgi:membrane-bound lytic murein transglycosylase B